QRPPPLGAAPERRRLPRLRPGRADGTGLRTPAAGRVQRCGAGDAGRTAGTPGRGLEAIAGASHSPAGPGRGRPCDVTSEAAHVAAAVRVDPRGARLTHFLLPGQRAVLPQLLL